MALSRLAAQFAAEIKQHDWSDAPFRADRAGHDRAVDRPGGQQLQPEQTERVTANVAWVSAQVLAYNDPNFDEYEYFRACGLDWRNRDGSPNKGITAGLRYDTAADGSRKFHVPGTWESDSTTA